MYPQLDYARHLDTTLNIDETLMVRVLLNSAGRPTMSDEDVKLSLLSLLNTCTHQQKIIDELVRCVNDLRTPKKKSWFHRK